MTKLIFRLNGTGKRWLADITVTIILFMVVSITAITIELNNNKNNVTESYIEQQNVLVDQLTEILRVMIQSGSDDEDIAGYMSELDASGAKFYVVCHDDRVIFAKSSFTTDNLGQLEDETLFFDSLTGQDITTSRSFIETDNGKYEIYIIADTDTIRSDLDLTRHYYYILLYVGIICFVELGLLISLFGYIRDVSVKLTKTESELAERNEEMEKLSRQLSANEGDKSDMTNAGVGSGIVKTAQVHFYNVHTIRMLLEKSDDAELSSVYIVFAELDMKQRYYSKDEIFEIMGNFKKELKNNEIIGEVRKGVFVILLYKYSEADALGRIEKLSSVAYDLRTRFMVNLSLRIVKPDERLPVKRFEEGLG